MLETLLKKDKIIIISGIVIITVLSWFYLFYLAFDMQSMNMADEMAMPRISKWNPVEFLLMYIMWFVMMIGMMIPSASPMILVFAAVNRKRKEKDRPYVPTFVFMLGYLAIWALFSLFATGAQFYLVEYGLLGHSMKSTSSIFGGIILLAAGIFQWTPLKNVCLDHCRSPLDFIMNKWREGYKGAFLMGIKHGTFCLGCCWVLMLILFVTGVMNLFWVAVIAIFVLIEKVSKNGLLIGRISGLLLILYGLILIF